VVAVKKLAVLFALAFALDAGAQCICQNRSLKWDYKKAAAVFIADAAPRPEPGGALLLYVERAWKGPYKPGDVMPAGIAGIDTCDFYFVKGNRYLVIADNESPGPESYRVLTCSHTGNVAYERTQRWIAEIERKHRWWDSRLSSIGSRRR
jgi:hypothetical protein